MLRTAALLALVGCSAPYPISSVDAGVSAIAFDTDPPEVSFNNSAHAAWLSPGPHVLWGTATDLMSPVTEVDINGAPVSVSPTGLFTYERDFKPGAHTLVVTATDAAGNTSSSTVGFVVGDPAPYRPTLAGAAFAVARQEVFDLAAERLVDVFDGALDLAEGDLFSPHSGCAVLDGVVDGLVVGDAAAELSTDAAAGALRMSVMYEFVSVDFSGTADICGEPEPFTAYATVSGPAMHLTLTPSVVDGALSLEITDVELEIVDVLVDAPGLEAPLSDAGIDDAELGVADAIGNGFQGMIADREASAATYTDVIADALPRVSMGPSQVAIGGLSLRGISVGETAIRMGYTATYHPPSNRAFSLQPATWVRLSPGYPLRGGEDADAQVAYAIDAVNHALFTGWMSGGLSREVSVDGFGLPAVAILTPALPPMVQPSDDGGLELVFAEIGVEVVPDGGTRTTLAAARGFATVALGVGLDRQRVLLSLDILSGNEAAGLLEDALLMPVTELLSEALPERIPIGRLESGEAVDATVGLGGRADGWLVQSLIVSP